MRAAACALWPATPAAPLADASGDTAPLANGAGAVGLACPGTVAGAAGPDETATADGCAACCTCSGCCCCCCCCCCFCCCETLVWLVMEERTMSRMRNELAADGVAENGERTRRAELSALRSTPSIRSSTTGGSKQD
jgi:hypothetical protein